MPAIRTLALGLLALVASGLAGPRPATAASYTLTTLASFNGANGAGPFGPLVRDAAGNLFGMTNQGGASNVGTVWELAAGSNTITPLASFNGANGAIPFGGLVRDAQGNLFGTAGGGGSSNQGTVWELAAGSSTITALASFNGANGAIPSAALVRDAAGNLFGTAQLGGSSNQGTVWELAAGSSTITALASFNGSNGAHPLGGLVRDAQGNLFGSAASGGASNLGTVFELAAGSSSITALASFNGANGSSPQAALVRDAAGNLFGAANAGGIGFNGSPSSGLGTVWELAAGSSTITTLASFNGANGFNPETGLVRDAAGNLFGTTEGGGTSGLQEGTVWELAAGSSTITTLALFNGANGFRPASPLLLDAAGNLFGTTNSGGTSRQGTVFELSPVPEPASLVLLGTGLLGALGAGSLRRGWVRRVAGQLVVRAAQRQEAFRSARLSVPNEAYP